MGPNNDHTLPSGRPLVFAGGATPLTLEARRRPPGAVMGAGLKKGRSSSHGLQALGLSIGPGGSAIPPLEGAVKAGLGGVAKAPSHLG